MPYLCNPLPPDSDAVGSKRAISENVGNNNKLLVWTDQNHVTI